MVPSARPVRLCHVAATSEGAVWMVEQLRELRDRFNYDVTAIIAEADGTLAEHLDGTGIRSIRFDFQYPGSGHFFTLLRRVNALAAIFADEKFDIVQTHLFNSMVLGRLAAWLADVPVNLSMISGPYHLEAYTPRWIDRDTAWMTTALIGSCEYTCQLYRDMGMPEDRLALVYYGPNHHKFDPSAIRSAGIRAELGWSPDAPVIGMIAYFYPKPFASRWTPPKLYNRANKRQEDLLRSVPRVLRVFPDAKFLFVGSGWGEEGEADLKEIQALVRELCVTDAVAFTGFRSDVADILVDIDISVQASLSENLGGTIESLLLERPLVATRVGGMVDSVQDGVTGLLVPPLDPVSLGDAIIRLLRDPDWAKSMARDGRELMLERFTLDKTVEALHALYKERLSVDDGKLRAGYRRWAQLWRRCVSGFVFSYLAGRLLIDIYVLPYFWPVQASDDRTE
ncbi:MAG: glycosyltransferase family 4 protein [Hyphomicrobiales bacterium]|nr:glycosyltransferase family 4 protein [Hyphomicrobiales bacterium]